MTIIHVRILGREGNYRFWVSKDPYEMNPTPSYESEKLYKTKKETKDALDRFLKGKRKDWGEIDIRWSN